MRATCWLVQTTFNLRQTLLSSMLNKVDSRKFKKNQKEWPTRVRIERGAVLGSKSSNCWLIRALRRIPASSPWLLINTEGCFTQQAKTELFTVKTCKWSRLQELSKLQMHDHVSSRLILTWNDFMCLQKKALSLSLTSGIPNHLWWCTLRALVNLKRTIQWTTLNRWIWIEIATSCFVAQKRA